VVWGPLAGYFAARQNVPLDIRPVQSKPDEKLPVAFGISIAVRYGEDQFREKLDGILKQDHGEIKRILADYHIPTVPEPQQKFDLEGEK
jgi:mxaJ protein